MTDKIKVVGAPNDILRIDEIYLFVSKDATGNEGVTAYYDRLNQQWLPLVCADQARIDSLRNLALEVALATGSEVKLIRYSTREEIETIAEAQAKQ